VPFGESDMRSKLIDPAIHARGWTEDLIRREETPGTIEIYEGRPRRQSRGRVDYTLRIKDWVYPPRQKGASRPGARCLS
jgi:type I restriction enzyme R subunit